MHGSLGHSSAGAGGADSIEAKEPKMLKRLMRVRVLKDHFVLDGISLPKGDYDGEISWSDQPYRGHPNRIRGPSTIAVTRAILETTGQSIQKDLLPIDLDISTAVKRGDIVIL